MLPPREIQTTPSTPQQKPPPGKPSTADASTSKPASNARAAQHHPAEAGGMGGASGVRGQAAVLFTAFEPSCDAHAAPIIAQLLKEAPHLKVYAWGGAKMEAAGATILGRTADDGAM